MRYAYPYELESQPEGGFTVDVPGTCPRRSRKVNHGG